MLVLVPNKAEAFLGSRIVLTLRARPLREPGGSLLLFQISHRRKGVVGCGGREDLMLAALGGLGIVGIIVVIVIILAVLYFVRR
jgi:hypothetical protein